MSSAQSRPRWFFLLQPRWLAWHAFAVCAGIGMLWLGDWQLHRAEAGNELSWAYTFEWPLFTALGIAFWVRTVREELSSPTSARQQPTEGARVGAGAEDDTADESAAAAYAARLTAEVRRHGRWHGLR
jgi:hypothetical protein